MIRLLVLGLFFLLSPPAISTELTFQNGVNGYTSTVDTDIQERNPSTSTGGNSSIAVDLEDSGSDSEREGLIRFDSIFGSGASQIPIGSIINSASIQFHVFDSGDDISLHRMLVTWGESSTWNSLSDGIDTDGSDALAIPDVTRDGDAGSVLFTGLGPTVQAWSDGASNFGWGMINDDTGGWDADSSEDGTVSYHPKLIVDFTLSTTISGVVYSDEGVSNIGSGVTIRLLVNGVSKGVDTTDASGFFTISTTLSAGDWILVYVDGHGSYKGVSVTESNGASLSGFDIYLDHLVVRNDNGGSLDGGDLSSAKGAYSDSDILFSVSGSSVTVSGSATEFLVPAGETFLGVGNLSTTHLHIEGSYNALASTLTVNGDWINNGVFTAGSSMVMFSGTSQSLIGSTVFNDFQKIVAATDMLTFQAGSTQTINGNVTMTGASGNLLRLRSSSGGSQWAWVLGASAVSTIQYVDVQDSDASGSDSGAIPIHPYASIDSGNLNSWFGLASLGVIKSTTVISDPFNGTSNPKRIPGAVIEYSLQSNNAGVNRPDTNSVTVTDEIDSASLTFDVSTGITFTDGTNSSGLVTNAISYSNNGGGSYAYAPIPDGAGYDGSITNIKVTTTGDFNNSGFFTLKYRVKIK